MHFSKLTLITIATAGTTLASPLQVRAAASPSASCTGKLVANPPQQYICNQEGKLKEADGYLGSTPKNNVNSPEDCYQMCYVMSGKSGPCRTFSYNEADGYCSFYSESIKSQDFMADASTGNFFYNSAHCWKNKCVTPTPSKTSASSTKKSTAKPTSTKKATTTKLPLPITTSKTKTSVHLTTATTKITITKPHPTTSSTKAPAPEPTCSTPNLSIDKCHTTKVSVLANVLPYTSYFSGSKLTENPNNPANILGLLHTTTTFPGTQSACEAVASCADQATLLGLASLAMSFDLHFVDETEAGGVCEADGSAGRWECVTYSGVASDQSQFNVRNESVKAVFGYSGKLQIL